MAQVVNFDALRSVGHASITGSYTAVGTPLANAARLICITNTNDTDMLVSVDGSTDMLIIPHGSFKLFDFTTNRSHIEQLFVLPINTQFYVKYVSAPGSGSLYIEVIYAS